MAIVINAHFFDGSCMKSPMRRKEAELYRRKLILIVQSLSKEYREQESVYHTNRGFFHIERIRSFQRLVTDDKTGRLNSYLHPIFLVQEPREGHKMILYKQTFTRQTADLS